MKAKLHHAIVAIAVCVSCTGLEDVSDKAIVLSDTPVTFSVSIAQTKTYSPIGRLTWSEGDIIYVGTNLASFTKSNMTGGARVVLTAADISSDGRNATIQAVGLPEGATTYYAAAVDNDNRFYGISSTGNVSSGAFGGGTRDGEFPHIGVASCPASSELNLKFQNADCILHWRDDSGKIKGVKITGAGGEDVIYTYTINADNLAVSNKVSRYTSYGSRMWATATDMYCLLAPGLSFPNGLELRAYSSAWLDTPNGGDVSEINYIGRAITPAVTTYPGLFLDYGDLSSRISCATPLSSVTALSGGSAVSTSIDQDTKTVNILHIPDPELLSSISFNCTDGYSHTLTGSWPSKVLKCTKGIDEVDYKVVLADYVGADDYFRTYAENFESDWKIMWADEFKTADYDHDAWYQCEAGPSYWNDHMDPSNSTLVTMHQEKDAKHDGHVALWAKTGSNATEQKTYNGTTYPRYDGYVTGGIQGGINRAGKHFYHPTLPPEGSTSYRVDIRMSAQKAKGFWPAVWMTSPDTISPYLVAGEMDLAEVLTNKNKVYQTCHNIYSNTNSKTLSHNMAIGYTAGEDNWLMYSVVVDDTSLRYYVNGTLKMTYENTGEGNEYFPYNQGYHYQIILSAQLGNSDWMWFNDTKPDGTDLPVCMKVDFVRIYCK